MKKYKLSAQIAILGFTISPDKDGIADVPDELIGTPEFSELLARFPQDIYPFGGTVKADTAPVKGADKAE